MHFMLAQLHYPGCRIRAQGQDLRFDAVLNAAFAELEDDLFDATE
jgi:hypothetical protein